MNRLQRCYNKCGHLNRQYFPLAVLHRRGHAELLHNKDDR